MNGRDLLKTLFEFAEILIHPSCWARNYKFDKELDRRINTLIECKDKYTIWRSGCWLKFTDKATHVVYGFWVENNYYASLSKGYIEQPGSSIAGGQMVQFMYMPSRRTVLRFFRTFKNEIRAKPKNNNGNIEKFFRSMQ